VPPPTTVSLPKPLISPTFSKFFSMNSSPNWFEAFNAYWEDPPPFQFFLCTAAFFPVGCSSKATLPGKSS
jgi:hypothetical protein